MQLIEFLQKPWAWYVAGPLIGLTVPALLLLGNKPFGLSSNLRHICAAVLPANIPFFQYDWKKESWNLFFAMGIILGGFLATHFLENPNPIELSAATKADLQALGIKDFSGLLPNDLFGTEHFFSMTGLIFCVFGGFLVGFGTRWANGCTSGHAIMGLSMLNVPSLIATCCFMAGGFLMSNWLLPYVIQWCLK